MDGLPKYFILSKACNFLVLVTRAQNEILQNEEADRHKENIDGADGETLNMS